MISNSSQGIVFNIQRFSVQDGYGIRTLVFLSGCPLRCTWCCNPESQQMSASLIQLRMRCMHCMHCVDACPNDSISYNHGDFVIDRDRCVACGLCASVCYSGALEMSGKAMSLDEVMTEILCDGLMYKNSGGGVTLSGGEPLFQDDFAIAIFKECKNHSIHTAIETCGYVEWNILERAMPYIDLFLYDLKLMDSNKHRQFTGKGNELIRNNIIKILKNDKDVIVRLPIIPGVNDDDQNLLETIEFMQSAGVRNINILPFHKLAQGKYESLGDEYDYKYVDTLPDDVIDSIFKKYELAGFEVTVCKH